MFIWLRILAPNFRPYFTLIQTPGIRIPWLTLIGTVCCYLNKWYNSCKGTYSSLLSIWLRVWKIRTQQIITIVLKTILKISRHAENHVKSFKVCWNIVFKMHYRFQHVLKFSFQHALQISEHSEIFKMLFQDVFNTLEFQGVLKHSFQNVLQISTCSEI